MNLGDLSNSINEINKKFSSRIQKTNVRSEGNIISWEGYEFGILNEMPYVVEYQRLIDNKQYSFLLMDDSFFQFYFSFNEGELDHAKLAYYPCPLEINDAYEQLLELAEESGKDILEDYYFGAEEWQKKGINISNTSSIRLDYDPRAKNHSLCHLQFSSINELRIDSKKLINPFLFFIWILNSRKDDFLEQKKDSHGFIQTLNYQKRITLDIPTQSIHNFMLNTSNRS